MRHSVTLEVVFFVFLRFFDQETKGKFLAGPRRHFLTPSLFLPSPRPLFLHKIVVRRIRHGLNHRDAKRSQPVSPENVAGAARR